MCDSDGDIWLGTFAGGVNLYNSQRNEFYYPKLLSGSQDIRCFYEDGGLIYVGGNKGVDIIRKATSSY